MKFFWIPLLIIIYTLLSGCCNSSNEKTTYGPLGFCQKTQHDYLKPGPATIDLNLKTLGFKPEERPSGDRTTIGWGACTVRND